MARPSSADDADIAACAAILRKGSKSFAAASLLLPPRVRRQATALYAFCRVADDAIDQVSDDAALPRLRRRLDRAYQGRPEPSPVDRAFSAVVIRARIPRAIPEALLEGFAWDVEARRYATIGELEAYAVRVAGTVGLMMALVMGVRNEAALARALDLGVAMQLTNIARDVGEDARSGRLYLPLDWLEEAGVDARALLARPAHDAAVASVVRRLIETADRYYARADLGLAALPADCRPAIAAARSIYSGIGREIARAGYDSVSRRAVVSGRDKIWRLVAASAAVAAAPQRAPAPPSVEAGRPLLAAVAALGAPPAPEALRFGDRVGVVLDAFARLERRDAGGRAAEHV